MGYRRNISFNTKTTLEKADCVIYLDYSTLAQIKGVLGRFIKNHGKEKEEIPGCKEKMSLDFFWWVVNWRKNKREGVIEALQGVESSKVHIFKKRKQLNIWYENQFNNKIET